ncbi:hypothetical protein B484DRAFT_65478 [Ochromonadaceae sp. CCMP2298]|nr:hypothetical protein B484DRAFT_65478 [Ochromonadaceae sp. CCMP2298]|mmetsp:Transcript_7380/g.16121  ORF Transcript_7380/g.16121 Transcript_7380/m.16121 type:complete len:781 (-) Transcript_7380:51-2393(-)
MRSCRNHLLLAVLVGVASLSFGIAFRSRWLGNGKVAVSLYSTKINWESLPINRAVEDEVDRDKSPRLRALIDTSSPRLVDVEPMLSKWIDLCIEESRPDDLSKFSLRTVIPMVQEVDALVEIVNATLDRVQAIDFSETFITEQELKKLWMLNSNQAMAKGVGKYNARDALLLIDDEDVAEVMGDDYTSALGLSSLEVSKLAEVDETDRELVITEQELRRLWGVRAEVKWGMPGAEFDAKMALLLLDPDDDFEEMLAASVEDEEEGKEEGIEYVNSLQDSRDGRESIDGKDKLAFWNKYTGRSNQYLRETLRRMYEELEQTENHRPAWKKDRSFLSPDVDTQNFMGDIMFSNTYLTQRIPANWEDPEKDEMSDTYLSTGSMAWPGQEETNFNYKLPIWEDLQLPFGPKHAQESGLVAALLAEGVDPGAGALATLGLLIAPEASMPVVVVAEAVAVAGAGGDDVDWASFDFASADTAEAVEVAVEPKTEKTEIDDFFKSFDEEEETNFDDLTDEENAARRRDILYQKAVQSANFSNLVAPPWRTPVEWITRPEFADHVDISAWSSYDDRAFEGADDMIWDDDVFMAQSLQHLQSVTDEYLDDHKGAVVAYDRRKSWDRHLRNSFLGEEVSQEPIPDYLRPDLNRGITYSDEVIEMKGKVTLHPEYVSPAEEYKNDSFSYNTDFMALNQIGTIREQYEWTPGESGGYLIETEKLAKLAPLIDYINHAGQLLSTKDNVVVFEYKGRMRHIIGVRASMMALAKKAYPELVELRLETTKKADKFDY